MNPFHFKSSLSCAILLALLQGCGGGGGGGSDSKTPASTSTGGGAPTATELPPAAPAASIAFAPKQLQFSWAAVSGATFYRVIEDVDGSGAFAQIGGDMTGTTYARDIAVHTFNWTTTRYQVQACNDIGCTNSPTLSAANGVLQTIGYFKASNTGSGDTFGWSLALSDDGTTIAVGAPSEDGSNNSSVDSGAVYVFANTGSGWAQQAYLKAATVLAGANFGESVALSSDGTRLAIGAPLEDNSAGSVYVFIRNDTAWDQVSRIKADNAYNDAYFGWSVALSDDGQTLAVGSPGEANALSTLNTTNHNAGNAGAAYVFTLNASGVKSSQIYLKASTIAANDNFGAATALSGSGNVLAVGSPYTASGTGAAYVFTRSGSTWGTPAYLAVSDSGTGNFGAALALDTAGNTLAIGAPYEAANAGAAYVFTRSTNTGAWGQQPVRIQGSNTEANDNFGSALALNSDGSVLAVGAIGESSSATGIGGDQTDNSKDGVGAVYLFNRSGAAWPQQTYVKPSTSTLGNEFGTAIGLSADSSALAISGAFEQSNATGIGAAQTDTSATDAGALWLF